MARQQPGMKPGGGRSVGAGGGDERYSGEDADGVARTLPAEPRGWRAHGRQGVLLLAPGRPHPRHHSAHVQARKSLPAGREVGEAPGGTPRCEALAPPRACGVAPRRCSGTACLSVHL